MIRHPRLGLLLLLFLLASCEETFVATDMPYEEKLVIEDLLVAGIPDTLTIGRTLPTDRSVSDEEYVVTDAEGEITSGTERFPLRPTEIAGRYYAEGLIPEVGRSYEIHVRWNGLQATAATRIPTPTPIERAYLTSGNEIMLEVRADANAGVRSFYETTSASGYTYRSADYDVFSIEEADASGLLTIREYFYTGSTDKEVYAGLYTYDRAYYDYFRYRYGSDVSIFDGQESQRRWNVTGNGIGIFVGRSESRLKLQ